MGDRTPAVQSIVVTLPLPNPKLHAHNTGHWRGKAKPTKELRALAKKRTLEAMKGKKVRWQKAKVIYRFYFPTNARRDSGNALQSQKAAIDGVVDSGLIPDDSWQYLKVAGIDCSIDRENPRTELVFTRVGT